MESKISKTAIIEEVAAATELKKSEVKTVLDAFWKILIKHVAEGVRVTFIGLGSFYKRHSDAREGYNPHTGTKMTIAAQDKLAFKSAYKFED